ncbi:radical SAM family heme chaperone HemW [Clostridiaceae bacterium HSG29]|nr:radical SAM family heme chaperone HemW [Clostridiaceae bacterium HSG29]
MKTNKERLGIYIHIPFCKSKCIYCDFVSVTNQSLTDKYFDYLLKEIEMYKEVLNQFKVVTIYFGGGTPSLVDALYIEKVVNKIKEYTDLNDILEFTIEVNPGTLNREKLEVYKKVGINRISIGLQSTNNNTLKMLGRIHDYDEFLDSYNLIREVGFNNVSVDLMFGLPGQTVEMFESSIDKVIKLNPEHISAYSLKVEESTKLYKLIKKGVLEEPNEEIDRVMYELLIDKLSENKYNLYEISNFSKNEFESKHNMIYWERENYLGLGLAAHGFIDNKRYGNVISFNEYFNIIDNEIKPVEETSVISEEECLFEEVMLGLRLSKGINYKKLNEKYNIDFIKDHNQEVIELLEEKMIEMNNESIWITKKGMSVSNAIITKII